MGKAKQKTAAVRRLVTVDECLQSLYEDHGKLTPDLVVSAARDPESPLHGHFNWDVEAAALEQWREVARGLIRSVRVMFSTETMQISSVAYVRDPGLPANEQGYVRVGDVRRDKDAAHAVLVAEFSRAAAALTRSRELAAVFGLREEVEDLIERVHTAKRRTDEGVAAQ